MARAYVANGTIRRARFVKLDPADNQSVLEADANDRIFGISQLGSREPPLPSVTANPPEAAQAGDHVDVFNDPGEQCLLQVGAGGWTAGDLLKSDADGIGVAAAETAGLKEEVGARALETAAAGELGRVEIYKATVTTPV